MLLGIINIKSPYKLLAEAKCHAHEKNIAEIHFHEVGARDAVADIVSVQFKPFYSV